MVRQLIFGLTLAAHLAQGAVSYVATSGSNEADGSIGAPWQTIQKAADMVTAGDTVRVQPGTYDEDVTLVTDGSPGRGRITFVADGAVIVRRFEVTGDYVRLIGFELTHTSDIGKEAVWVTGATGVELHDLNIHDTSRNNYSGGLTYGNVTNLVVRGCRFVRTGILGNTASDTDAKAIGDAYGLPSSDRVLLEYLSMSNVVEYINPSGQRLIIRNQVWGPIGPDWPAAHTDGVQPNGGIQYSFIEAIWHEENGIDDSHFYLDEVSSTHHVVQRRNVSIRSGDVLLNQWRNSTNHYAAHNAWAETSIGPTRVLDNDHALLVWDSTNNWSYNEVFYLTTTDSVPYDLFGVGQLTLGSFIMGDPGWVNYPGRDLRLAPGSSAIDTGTNLTVTIGGGSSSTVVPLADAHWFHDGLGMTRGDGVYVGSNNNLRVMEVDWQAATITVDSPISWLQGDPVGYAYRGSGPEIGAYEYGDTLLTEATLTRIGDTYTVNVTGDARFVVFYTDGIPEDPDYTAPFTFTGIGVVTAKAYAMHAQPSPVVAAIDGNNRGPKLEVSTDRRADLSIRFPSALNAGYQIWVSDDLLHWHEQGEVLPGTGLMLEVTVESIEKGHRFIQLEMRDLGR